MIENLKAMNETIKNVLEITMLQRKTIDILTDRLNKLQDRVKELEMQVNSNGDR